MHQIIDKPECGTVFHSGATNNYHDIEKKKKKKKEMP